MRSKQKILVGLAVIVIGFILWGINSMRNTGEPEPAPGVPVADKGVAPQPGVVPVSSDMVAVALENIPERSILTVDMFRMQRREGAGNAGYITDLRNQAAGYVTRVSIPRGAALRREDLLGHITDVGIAGAIRPGLRAMTVPLVNKNTLHDLIRVGDYVDVVAAFEREESRTIVQNVRVLAVDTQGKDFPPVKVAMRGPNKAEPKGVGVGEAPVAPGSPPPAAPGPEGAPTPTPTPAPQAPPPGVVETAVTLEVSPQQATAISLAQAAQAAIDFILHPSPPAATGGTTPAVAQVVSITRPRLAPYAETRRQVGQRQAAARAAAPSRVDGPGPRFGGGRREVPLMPAVPSGAPSIGPLPPAQFPTSRETYSIPVYADGKQVRVDTVPKP